MAKLSNILKQNEKRLVINNFLPEAIREEGKEEFITIKKLTYADKKKIEFLSMNNLSGKAGKALFDLARKKGYSVESMDKLSKTEQLDIVYNVMSGEDGKNIMANAVELAQTIIDNGIDQDKHSFIDENDNPVKMNFTVLSQIGNDQLIDFVVEEIKKLSEGFVLGEKMRTV